MRAIPWRHVEPLTLTLWCALLAVAGSLLTQWPLRLDGLPAAGRPALMALALVVFIVALLRPWEKGFAERWSIYRLGPPRASAGGFILLLIAIPVLNYGSIALYTALAEPEQVWVPVLEGVMGEPGGLWMLLILLLLAAPLIEELLVRGRLQYQVGRRWGVPAAIAISATVFAWLHGLPQLVPVYVAFGVLLGIAVWLTGSVWTGVIIHALHNGATFGLFLLAASMDVAPAETSDAAADTAALLQAGGSALLLGAALLALALRIGHWPGRHSGGPVRWGPLLWIGPPLVALNAAPLFTG
ncbi:CPBP family intramembrane glutamic endopeptidase [Aquisalimonas asiatica]|uniref:CAAX protease self-immunity n=1 Tax=Aquisalimonas asiatica TaxID=406100 RepID=A0A1H8TDU3_9GAMM|nr:type II CAAX endopeptidase family protein [Aquisalimonas asiatica]SEO89082.1 CAAX protease self-immunity [Aquisalimonas asiatica]